jgi:tetratricopeptide (TPR) repeat protein
MNSIVADTLSSLAQVRLAQGSVAEAEKLVVEALDAHRHSGSTAHLKIGWLQTLLARVWIQANRFGDAERILRDTLALFAKQAFADHRYVSSAEYYLGEVLLAQRRFADAEDALTASMERWRRDAAPAWRAARSASALGVALDKLGRCEEAERYLVESYRVLVAEPDADEDAKHIARERVIGFYAERGQREKLDALLLELGPEEPSKRTGLRPRVVSDR